MSEEIKAPAEMQPVTEVHPEVVAQPGAYAYPFAQPIVPQEQYEPYQYYGGYPQRRGGFWRNLMSAIVPEFEQPYYQQPYAPVHEPYAPRYAPYAQPHFHQYAEPMPYAPRYEPYAPRPMYEPYGYGYQPRPIRNFFRNLFQW